MHVALVPLALLLFAGAIFAAAVLRFNLEAASRRKRLLLLESIGDGLMILDARLQCTYANAAARRIMDRNATVLDEFSAEIARAQADCETLERTAHFPQSGAWIELRVHPSDEELLVFLRDVTERKHTEERFVRMARSDVLTMLPNRLALEERLPALLERAVENRESVAVMYLDLDRFKSINDTLGHAGGDELLRAVARRLEQRLHDQHAVFRTGGDEFVIVLERVRHKRTVAAAAADVLDAFAEPFTIAGREIFTTASVGSSIFPQNAQTVAELIAFADSAMYRAKESGRNNAKFYDGNMHAHVLERLGLEQDLRLALSRGELRLCYQPIVDSSGTVVVGAEALLRWDHPLLGELAPGIFIPIAEETGTIVEISRWVLRTACAETVRLRAQRPDFRIAVNLSPRDLLETDFPDELGTILQETQLPPHALDVEVTESVMLNDLAVAALAQLHHLGVRVVIDDFGTGYSSLGYIKRLPVSAIKIDKSFIADVSRETSDQAIVKAVATLGRTLGLRVIAEGIETHAQWEFMHALACDQAQGYYFKGPGPWSAVVEMALREPARVPGGAQVIALDPTRLLS